MTRHIASTFVCAAGRRIVADVFEVDDSPETAPTYYFCCNHCGNCGRHVPRQQTALDEALEHLSAGHLPQTRSIDDARTALLGGENSAVAHMLGVDKNAVNRIAGS